jgi:hypothetical protein
MVETNDQIEKAQKVIDDARKAKREVASSVKEKMFKQNEAELKSHALKTRLE